MKSCWAARVRRLEPIWADGCPVDSALLPFLLGTLLPTSIEVQKCPFQEESSLLTGSVHFHVKGKGSL